MSKTILYLMCLKSMMLSIVLLMMPMLVKSQEDFPNTSSSDSSIVFQTNDGRVWVAIPLEQAKETTKGLTQEREMMEKMEIREAQVIDCKGALMAANRTIHAQDKRLKGQEQLLGQKDNRLNECHQEQTKLARKNDSLKTQRNTLAVVGAVLLVIILL